MTTPDWKSFSVRLAKPRKEELDNKITEYLKTSELNKADAVFKLINLGLGKEPLDPDLEVETDDILIQDVLDEVRNHIECSYITHDTDGFSCLEKIAQTKKPSPLGFNPTKALGYCQACANKKLETRVQKQNELLNRAGAKQLKDFLRRMVQLKNQDFGINVFLCMGETTDNKIQASADGESLKCPLLPENETQTVFIETYCKQKINPVDGSTGCPSLVSFTQVTNLDESFFKQFTPEHPELENLEPIVIVPAKVKGVNAEYKVVDEDEKEENEND